MLTPHKCPLWEAFSTKNQEIHHKGTKDTNAKTLFFLVIFVSLGGLIFRLPFREKRDPSERLPLMERYGRPTRGSTPLHRLRVPALKSRN